MKHILLMGAVALSFAVPASAQNRELPGYLPDYVRIAGTGTAGVLGNVDSQAPLIDCQEFSSSGCDANEQTLPLGTLAGNVDSIFKGGGFSFGIGYEFDYLDFPLKLELTTDYRKVALDVEGSNSEGAGLVTGAAADMEFMDPGQGNVDTWSVMLNGIAGFTFSESLPVSAYVGGGVGVAGLSNFTAYNLKDADGNIANGVDKANIIGFGLDVMAGLAYRISEQLSVDMGYKFMWTPNKSVSGFVATSDKTAPHDISYNDHSLMLGLTWRFDGGASSYTPPPPPPVAPPAPPPMPAPPAPPPMPEPVFDCTAQDQSFTVYFAINKVDLGEEDRLKVRRAVANAGRNDCSIVGVTITGYTDRSGNAAYNKILAGKRANSVKRSLTEAGIPEALFQINAAGESDPSRRVADGAKDSLSRRAEVYIRVN